MQYKIPCIFNFHNLKKILPVLLLLLIAGKFSFGQIQANLQAPPVNRLQVKDIWNIRINNPQNINKQVYLKAQVADKNGQETARFRTEAFNLSPGLQRLNPNDVRVTQQDFYDAQAENTLKRTKNFPEGNYQVTVKVFDATTDEPIAESTIKHKVTNIYAKAAEVVGANQENLVTFYGNGHVEGHSSNRQGPGQFIPKQYVRSDVNATLEIGVAPINFHGHLTSMSSDLRQSANEFTVSFDDQRFINNLRNRLTKVIEEETGLKKEKYGEATSKLKKLDNIDRLLKNNTLEQELENTGSLSNIESQIQNADLQGAIDQINQIKKNISNRVTGLNYKAQKQKLQTELEVHQEIAYDDAAKEKKRLRKIDSLKTEMKKLEQKRQETKEKNNEDLARLKKLQKKQQKLNNLKEKKQKVENLLAKKDQLKRLKKQKDKLLQYKEKLRESGDLEALKSFNVSKLRDKDILKNELQKRGMLSRGQNLLYSIEELSAGTIYPYYSPLVLNGLRISGVSFEWNPGIFYLAFSGGTSNRPRFSLNDGIAEYNQRLLAGKIGVGKKHKSHLFFTALDAIDDRNSIERNDTINTPKSNFILGSDVGLQFFNGKFKIQGELAGSKFTKDEEATQLITNNALNDQIPDFLEPNVSTKFGLAYDVRGAIKLFKNNTVVSGFLRNIDPSYNSFGAPNLRRGVFTYNTEISQKLFSRNMTISAFRKNESTTRLWQDGLTHYERQGAKLRIGFTNIPNISVSYAEGIQDKESIDNSTSELMINGSYSYKIGKLSLSNTVNYNLNKAESSQVNGPDYEVANYLFNQLVSFSFPLSLSLNVNYLDEVMQGEESELIISDLSASFQLFKQLNISLGGNYKTRADQNKKFGGFMDVNYSFANHFTFELSFDNNYYDDMMMPVYDFNEYILNSRLSVRW